MKRFALRFVAPDVRRYQPASMAYTCYCMCMLSHRLQILLDDERYQRVNTAARQRGMSVGAVIREAIDRGLPATQRRRSAAARTILSAEPMDVPHPDELRTELDEVRGRHG